jgi:cytochrome c oxidase subunit 3
MAHALLHQQPVERDVTPQLRVIHGFGGGDPPAGTWTPPISNTQLAVLVLIAFETMTFAGLVTAYWVLRAGSFSWPPPNLPRLPLAVTWVNTAMLLFSAVTMTRAKSAGRAANCQGVRVALAATAVLGGGFVAVQGTEWARLLRQGLRLSSGAYGATFYTLIGLHALHVVAALVWLLVVLALAYRRDTPAIQSAVRLCAMYWYFVCGLWAVLFGVVYLY